MPSWYAGKNDEMPLGGIFHYEQAKELGKKCKVAIYYPFDKSLKQENISGIERGVLTYRSYFNRRHRFFNIIRMIKTFKKINKEFQPEIIHAHVATEVGRYALVLSKLFRKPLIVTEHSTMECSGVSKGIGKIYGKLVYSHSKYNICVSEDLQYKLQTTFPRCKFHTIYNGIIKPNRSHNQNFYRIPNKVNIVLVAALYSPDIKGIQYVLPAIRKLLNEGYNLIFHIVGDGEYREYFERMAEEYEIRNNCIFYGACSKQKVFDIIDQMDFLISASLAESFGCSLAEAMMLGKPVIATRSGGPESFVNEDVGILIDKGDETAIVNGLRKMINMFDRYDSEKIRNFAYEKFEMGKICDCYLKLYHNMINK